jgi:photosystem II stability/assembly factor-like uncharacterized protein
MIIRPFVLLITVVLSWCVSQAVSAQGVWHWAGNGLSGIVQSFYVAPNGDFFCGTNIGVFQTKDSGRTWSRLGRSDQAITEIQSITVTSKSSIFASGSSLFRSTDFGQTWQSVNAGFFASIVTGPGDNLLASTDSGVFRSTDDGMSWTCATAALGRVNSRALTISPNGHIFAACSGRGMLRSIDSGVTWQSMNSGMSSLSLTTIACDSAGNLYACAWNGVMGRLFRSTNDGTSWTLTSADDVTTIAVLQDSILVGGTNSHGVVISRSHGVYWEYINSGLTFNSDRWGIPAVGSYGDRLFVSATDHGFCTTTDRGAHWTCDSQYLENADIKMIAQSASGNLLACAWDNPTSHVCIMRSQDQGQTWQHADSGIMARNANVLKSVGNLFFMSSDSLYRWTDEGHPWQAVLGPVNALTWDNALEIVVATTDSVCRSSDYGTTWQSFRMPWRNNTFTTLAADSSGNIYGALFPGSTSGTIARSSDKGISWQIVDLNVFTKRFATDTLAISKLEVSKYGTLFTGGYYGGLQRSSDQGLTWRTVGTTGAVFDLAIDSEQTIYLFCGRVSFPTGTWSVMRSTDDGLHWVKCDSGIPTGIFSNYGSLSVGRSGIFLGLPIGVLKFDNSSFAGVPEENTVLSQSIFPNPATTSFSMDILLSEASMVRIAILDVTGHSVQPPISVLLGAGDQRVTIDRGNINPGLYFVSLQYNGKRVTSPVILR